MSSIPPLSSASISSSSSYGASDKPKSDFWQLLGGFFMPFNGIESSEGTDSEGNPAVEFGFSNDINQALVKFSEFSPN
ncbi:MAG: hypothetical protein HYX67_03315 [Candidatus Melainabacteria bacterium]|nr:hypothetical protein [Candidatus Melainabacteria bacterium]